MNPNKINIIISVGTEQLIEISWFTKNSKRHSRYGKRGSKKLLRARTSEKMSITIAKILRIAKPPYSLSVCCLQKAWNWQRKIKLTRDIHSTTKYLCMCFATLSQCVLVFWVLFVLRPPNFCMKMFNLCIWHHTEQDRNIRAQKCQNSKTFITESDRSCQTQLVSTYSLFF